MLPSPARLARGRRVPDGSPVVFAGVGSAAGQASAPSRSASTSARCRARRPSRNSICVRHEKPSARISVSFARRSQRRQQRQLRDVARDPLVARLRAEVAGEAAASLERLRGADAGGLHEPPVRGGSEHRLLVAVRLDEGRRSPPRPVEPSPPSPAARRTWSRGGSARPPPGRPAAARAGRGAAWWRRTAPGRGPARRRAAPGPSSVRRSSARARSSWPVVIAVRPQQTGVRGTTASKPAAASTRSAA